jgi:hypothetical protein
MNNVLIDSNPLRQVKAATFATHIGMITIPLSDNLSSEDDITI